jgi:glycosyltransferase involved in cell wall biosynthesis
VKPLVSVVMSVYNNAGDVGRALDSLLAQTYPNLEIVVVNDGSRDGSGDVLEAYAARDPRVRVFHQENAGLGPAVNRAMREARGVYLARHDADDASAPTRIERQVEYMEARPDVVLCGTWIRFVDPEGRPVATMEVPDDEALLRRMMEQGSNPLMHGSVMMRPEALEGGGGGDTALRRTARTTTCGCA